MQVTNPQNFYYDPKREGFSSAYWKLLSGSTPTIVSNKLRINNQEIVSFTNLFRGFYNFVVNIPATPTSALLTGGTSATSVVGTWTAVTDGEFTISLDGTAYDITGIDFSSGVSDMDDVAAAIQTAIRAATGNAFETVTWSTNKFIITARAAITVTSAVSGGSGTDISGVGATAFMDSETGRGTVTIATNSNAKWGLIQPSKNLKCYFELRGDTLVAVTSDDSGTAQETDITWNDSAWTGNDITFEIAWDGGGVKFKVNGDHYAFHETRIPRGPMSLYVQNELAYNLDVAYIEAIELETIV